MSRSIVDYFSQNYDKLVKSSVRICSYFTKNPSAIGEDVLHDVAVVLCKKENELTDVKDFGAYIGVCIRRAAINYVKKSARAIPVDMELITDKLDNYDACSEYDYFEWIASLEKHLQRFDPRMRKPFIAHYIDDVPSNKLAAELGITEKALSLRFARMRKELHDKAPSMFKHLNILLMIR